MSSEMYNTIARVTNGIYEGIAIGGDVFPVSTLSDHVLRFKWYCNCICYISTTSPCLMYCLQISRTYSWVNFKILLQTRHAETRKLYFRELGLEGRQISDTGAPVH